MNRLKLILLPALMAISAPVFASPISFGPFALDTDYAATTLIASADIFENKPDAIIDIGNGSENTYVRGISDDAFVTLGFNNVPLINRDGDDLVLYFLKPDDFTNKISLNINNVTKTELTARQLFINPDNPFVPATSGPHENEKFSVDKVLLRDGVTTGRFDLSAILIDLGDFGISNDQTTDEITVKLGNRAAFLINATGKNAPTPVPVPAAFILFLSGLTGLGLFNRNRQKA